MIRVLAGVVVVVGLVVGVVFLREELETRHEAMPAGSQLVVDAAARVHGPDEIAEPLARSLVSTCLVEAEASAQVESFEWRAHRHFRFTVRPALDEPDRRQLHGCLEDLRVPRLLVSVDHMATRLPPA